MLIGYTAFSATVRGGQIKVQIIRFCRDEIVIQAAFALCRGDADGCDSL